MAAISPTFQFIGNGEHTIRAQWANVTQADTFVPIGPRWADYADRSVQITGTFGGATVLVQGSNDGTNYSTLPNPQGSAISKTTAALEQIGPATLFVQPSHSGGTGESVTVTLVMRRGRGGMEV